MSTYISGEAFFNKESSMTLWVNWKYEVSLQKRWISILKGDASKIRRFHSENMRLPTLPLSHPNMNFESSKSSNPIIQLWSHLHTVQTLFRGMALKIWSLLKSCQNRMRVLTDLRLGVLDKHKWKGSCRKIISYFDNCKNLWESEWKMRRQNSLWWI